jgi:tetratricopeptide (TPR) repeat protein
VIGSALQRTSGSGEKNYEIRRVDWLREQCNLLFAKRQLDQAVQSCQEAWEIVSKSEAYQSVVGTSVMSLYAVLDAALGRRAEAAAALSIQAVWLDEKVAPGDIGTTLAQGNACDSLARMGDAARALPYCDSAIAGMLKAFGPDSGHTAEALSSKGTALLALERYADAVAENEETVRVYEKIGAGKHPTVVDALGGIGRAQLAIGQPRRAVATLERALAIADTIELNTPNDKVIGAEVRFALARALASSGGAPERIDHLASASADVYQSLGLDQRAREVTDWSGTRARPGAGTSSTASLQ